MDKVREKLRPIYKKFVADNIPNESSVITYGKLRYNIIFHRMAIFITLLLGTSCIKL